MSGLVRLTTAPVSLATSAVFAVASQVRGTKVFHPHGVVHEAVVVLDGDPRAPGFLGGEGEIEGVVRFSRGVGLPKRLPDVFGLALRMFDVHGAGRHQDFLLVTSGNGPAIQHLILPSPGWMALPYSTVLPYRTGRDVYTIGAKAPRRSGTPGAGQRWELDTMPLAGRMRRFGELRLGARLPDEANAIQFNPWNTGGGVQPAGPLQKLRDWAYPGSQLGWAGAPPENLSL